MITLDFIEFEIDRLYGELWPRVTQNERGGRPACYITRLHDVNLLAFNIVSPTGFAFLDFYPFHPLVLSSMRIAASEGLLYSNIQFEELSAYVHALDGRHAIGPFAWDLLGGICCREGFDRSGVIYNNKRRIISLVVGPQDKDALVDYISKLFVVCGSRAFIAVDESIDYGFHDDLVKKKGLGFFRPNIGLYAEKLSQSYFEELGHLAAEFVKNDDYEVLSDPRFIDVDFHAVMSYIDMYIHPPKISTSDSKLTKFIEWNIPGIDKIVHTALLGANYRCAAPDLLVIRDHIEAVGFRKLYGASHLTEIKKLELRLAPYINFTRFVVG